MQTFDNLQEISFISFSIAATDNFEQPLSESMQYWSHTSSSARRAKDEGRFVGTFWSGYKFADQMSPLKDLQGTPIKTKHGHAMWSCNIDNFSRVVPSRKDDGDALPLEDEQQLHPLHSLHPHNQPAGEGIQRLPSVASDYQNYLPSRQAKFLTKITCYGHFARTCTRVLTVEDFRQEQRAQDSRAETTVAVQGT